MDGRADLSELPKQGRKFGLAKVCVVGVLAFVLVAAFGIAAFLWSIQRSENSAFLRQQLLSSLETGLGPNHALSLDRAALQLNGVKPVFSIGGLEVKQEVTGARASLQRADFMLRANSLLRMAPQASTVSFEGLRIVLPEADPSAPMSSVVISDAKAAIYATVSVLQSMFQFASRETSLYRITGRAIDVFRREGAREAPVQTGLSIDLERGSDDLIITIGRDGISETIRILATGVASPDASAPFTLNVPKVPLGALTALAGVIVPGVSPDMTFALQALLDGKTSRVTLRAEGARIVRPDLGLPGLTVDEAEIALAIGDEAAGINVTRLLVRSGEALIDAKGTLRRTLEGALAVQLAAGDVRVHRPSPKEEVVRLARLELDGLVSADGRSFTANKVEFADDAGKGQLEAFVSAADGGKIETRLSAQGFDVRHALAIWPMTIAPELRDYLIQHLLGGRLVSLDLRSSMAGKVLEDAFALRPLPPEALAVRYRLEDAIFRAIGDAPPVRRGVLTGNDTARQANLVLETGEVEMSPGRVITLGRSEFRIDETAVQPAVLQMKIPFSGRVDTILALLATPSLRRAVDPPTGLAVQEGTAEGIVQGSLRLVDKPGPNDSKLDVNADIRGLRIDPIVKGERLEGANLQLVLREGRLNIKGEGRVTGQPSQIEWLVEPGKDAEGEIRVVLDEAARARRGVDLKQSLTGPVGAIVRITLPKRGQPDVDLEFDLTRAKVEGLVPGFVKRPGQAAKLTFGHAIKGERQILEDFDLDLGPVSARGRLELGADGQFLKAELASLKLSPGDNARASIEKQRNGLKISIRGNAFDLRPFLKGFQSGRIDDQKSVDLDIDIQTTVLIGFNNEILAGSDVQAVRRNGNLTRLTAKGRFGAEPITAETTEQKGDQITLVVNTTNAGALVRFMDLYPRAYGGRLQAEIAISSAGQSGRVMAWDFTVRGDPFLRQYAAGGGTAGAGPMSQATAGRAQDSVAFQKLRAEFVRSPGRIDFNEFVMWGAQVGGNIEGYLDYGADRVDLKGVLVPAYALNNLFAQVPLLGPIFGGSQYEGLFALPFIITGRASAPVLRTNALSVIAPGFLRKMFELRREDGPNGRRSNAPLPLGNSNR